MKKTILIIYVFLFCGGCYQMKEESQQIVSEEAVKQTELLKQQVSELKRIANALEGKIPIRVFNLTDSSVYYKK